MLPNVLITGATSGIGAALAARYAERANLLITGRRPVAEVAALLPAGATYVEADQSEPEEAARRIAGALAELGWVRLDIAILNAGSGWSGNPADEPAETIRQTLDANLMSAIALAQALYPHLEAARGRLVLIGSTARRGAPAFASYAAAKAGLEGLARALAEEWRNRITVQVIHPGPVATGIHAKAGFDPGNARRLFASPDKMARLIDRAVARPRSRQTISFAHYWTDAVMPWRR